MLIQDYLILHQFRHQLVLDNPKYRASESRIMKMALFIVANSKVHQEQNLEY